MRVWALLKALSLLLILMGATSCDQWASDRFKAYCEKNTGFMPDEKIEIDGAEFRGDFSRLSLPKSQLWFNLAEFYEFTPGGLTGKVSDRKEDGSYIWYDQLKRLRDLNIDERSAYRVTRFEEFGPECELFYRYARNTGETPSKSPRPTDDYKSEIMSDGRLCIGMHAVSDSLSDVIIEASFNPRATTIFFVPMQEYRIVVTSKQSNTRLADLREYTKEPRLFLFLDVLDGQAPASCNASTDSNPRPKWSVHHTIIALSHVFKQARAQYSSRTDPRPTTNVATRILTA